MKQDLLRWPHTHIPRIIHAVHPVGKYLLERYGGHPTPSSSWTYILGSDLRGSFEHLQVGVRDHALVEVKVHLTLPAKNSGHSSTLVSGRSFRGFKVWTSTQLTLYLGAIWHGVRRDNSARVPVHHPLYSVSLQRAGRT